MRILVSAVLAGAVALGAAPAAAQAPGIDFKLNPRIGAYVPLTDLGELGEEAVSLENSLAIGLGAELQFAGLPFGIRANLDYATGTELNSDADGFVESQEATLLAVAGDLVFRPLPSIILLQPYLFVGGGLKQYDIEPTGLVDNAEFQSESDPTVHLGVGLDFGLGPLSLNAEVGDYISWAEFTSDESEMQHDLFVTAGFSIGML